MQYYLILPSGQIGPISYEKLINFIDSGEANGATLGRQDSAHAWVPLAVLESTQHLFAVDSTIQSEEPAYASFGERFASSQVDGFIVFVIAIIGTASSVFFLNGPIGLPTLFFILFVNLMILPSIYFAWMHSSRYQATVGKRIVEIYIEKVNGRRVKFLRAMSRYWLMSFLFPFFWVMFLNPKRQMVHDILAKTVVIKGKK